MNYPTVDHDAEVASGERFEFGANWARFLALLDEDRIQEAQSSLMRLLRLDSLAGSRFLDVGSGSGLFSLAAYRLGAEVRSFDYDPKSVACTGELKRRYARVDPRWSVESGSVLDTAYLDRLGRFDVVYSWGVLHHTGSMWEALGNVERLVAPGGRLCIAIYNDQGGRSRRWRLLKQLYNRRPPLRFALIIYTLVRQWWAAVAKDALHGAPLRSWRVYKLRFRGMSPWHDVIDWIGGYPFEVARPEAIFDFYRDRGFRLEAMTTDGGSGCNEFVFVRTT